MEKIYQISLPIPYGEKEIHTYLIEADKLTLVDTGIKSNESWLAFQQKLQEIGYEATDVERVILTHHHPDHCGMLDYFPESVEVAAHPRNEMWLSQDQRLRTRYAQFFEQLGKEVGLPLALLEKSKDMSDLLLYSCKRTITEYIRGGDEIAGFQVIETPGHASTHISLLREEDGLFIGGDILLDRITSNPLIEPPIGAETERQKALLIYLDSLHRLAKMPIRKVLPGHGEIFENVHEVIDFQLGRQKRRAERVIEILRGRQMTVFDISKELYPLLYEKQYSLTTSQTIGQLDYLEYNNLVQVDRLGEQWLYALK